jgi:ParB family chromosome partitioning protein
MIPADCVDPPSEPVRQVKISIMEEIRDSIEADGLYQPIVVRPNGNRFEVVAGFHRYVALTTSGQKMLPCVVRECTHDEATLISIAENVQRNTHLDPIREGQIFTELIERDWTVEQIALKIGKRNLTYVTDRIHVYEKLHPKLQNRVSKGHLSFQNAKMLSGHPLAKQLEVAQKIAAWRKERNSASMQECRKCEIHCPRS